MTSVQLKSRLIELIQKEGDVGLLKLLDRLMDRSSEESAYREMLAYGVERSEADIKAGRVYTLEEAKVKAKASLRKK